MNRMIDPLERAIETSGGASKLATALGVTKAAVSHWKRTGRVPARHCLHIEELSGVSRYDLRPDIFGAGPKGRKVA